MMNVDDIQGFDWDDGNGTKDLHVRGVSIQESEQNFLDTPLVISQNFAHCSLNAVISKARPDSPSNLHIKLL